MREEFARTEEIPEHPGDVLVDHIHRSIGPDARRPSEQCEDQILVQQAHDIRHGFRQHLSE